MLVFNSVFIVIALIFIGLGFNLKYNKYKKINDLNLKSKLLFNPVLEEQLNKNYKSVVEIIGRSDIVLGVVLIMYVLLLILIPDNTKVNNIAFIIITVILIMYQVILKWKLKNIK